MSNHLTIIIGLYAHYRTDTIKTIIYILYVYTYTYENVILNYLLVL